MYKHEICRAGKTKQHTFYYCIRSGIKEGPRRKKANKTKEAQRKVNRRLCVKKLTWILNENFDETCFYITFSYDKEKRPEGKEVFKKDIEKLLRSLRRLYGKENRQAKYVWVAEIGERGAVHVHMVINNMQISKIKKCWKNGWVTIKPLDESGQYRKLAEYFIKYSDKTMKTEQGFGGRRYNSSRNMRIPVPKKTTIHAKNVYNHTIEVPQGWYLDKDSVAEAWHEVTGFLYFTYTVIYDGIKRGRKKDKYTLSLESGEVEITENWQQDSSQKQVRRWKGGKREKDGRTGLF